MIPKKVLENISKALPSFFKNSVDYLKTNFDNHGQKIFENAGGTAGVIVGLFAQPLIDSYFEKLSKNKLENFGLNTYLKAGLLQAKKSVQIIEGDIDKSLSPELVFKILNDGIKEEITSFDKKDLIFVFQPKNHPAILAVKESYMRILTDLGVPATELKKFQKDFNENIDETVIHEFGEDYNKHYKDAEKNWLKDNEVNLLLETIEAGKIGFKHGENLKYEKTFAQWKKVQNLRENEDVNIDEKENVENEKKLCDIETLIEEYFARTGSSNLERILFIVADFGKGKSVFMKHYAALLAKNYLQSSDGFFPIYFNLRDFKNYSSEPRLGIISDYLETRHSIKIDDQYFCKKKYIFLIDSLDESGDLNSRSISKVITSIKNIQGIDKTKFKDNRVIVTSRPFDDGLSQQLQQHEPFVIPNIEGRDISYFISVYGFTKAQFNDWIFDSLSNYPNLKELKTTGFAKKIIDSILQNSKLDVYAELLSNQTLSRSELRRPIFAYMIYQLIINNVDFLSVGKLGVYLSFLNLLTKEAKHIHDINYKVNLKEEFEFRNVLQATASLWMHERQKGRQGTLKKSDICRVLEGKTSNESDLAILERLKGQGLTEIQFLSHSYFGENDNVLHFQHQSFAEILLAEYYLKVLIKYALDSDSDLEEARVKLVLGEPTEQTMLFLKELLTLLRETSTSKITPEIIEKRKLLFPLMASLSTQRHNRLFCNDIFYSWYQRCTIKDNETEYPETSLKDWCINEGKINKIIELSQRIINSKHTYLPIQGFSKTALFDNEVLELQNTDISHLPLNIDKWICLLVGNTLFNSFETPKVPKLFNKNYKINFNALLEMLHGWNYSYGDPAPIWGKNLFMGMNMTGNPEQINLSHYNFDGINFSYSIFDNVRCWNANWSRSNLNYCSFLQTSIVTSLFYGTLIHEIEFLDDHFGIGNCELSPNGLKFFDLFQNTNSHSFKGIPETASKRMARMIFENDFREGDIFDTIRGFLVYGLKKSYFKFEDFEKIFNYENEETRKIFNNKLASLKKYEPK